MIVPVKLLPWILLIGGFLGLVTGEAPGFSIVMLLGGGVWLLIKASNKKGKPAAKAANSARPNSTPAPSRPAPQPAPAPQPVPQPERAVLSEGKCPSCGTVAEPGMLFCAQCGSKL